MTDIRIISGSTDGAHTRQSYQGRAQHMQKGDTNSKGEKFIPMSHTVLEISFQRRQLLQQNLGQCRRRTNLCE